ncbi:peptidase inhibitor family I36 protein [Streptomyces virginiae]|uniref:peptidase inhibitor family I36 protein n=1 Tax=Streptomyces virginiae TaxID=1961 RepID=UPI0033B6D53F
MSTQLPAGVVAITPDGAECPPKTLGLYRDYNRKGPGYGIGAGYDVDLAQLPLPGGGNMAKNVSAWWNRTDSNAILIGRTERVLKAGERLEEPSDSNDTVVRVTWEE